MSRKQQLRNIYNDNNSFERHISVYLFLVLKKNPPPSLRFKALFMWPGLLSTVVPPVRTRINVTPVEEDTGPKGPTKTVWCRTHTGGDLG